MFTRRDGKKVVDEFIKSEKRGVFIIGDSGSGKSNLLFKYFTELINDENIAVFIDAGQLRSANISEELIAYIKSQNLTINDFENHFVESDNQNFIFIYRCS